MQSTRRGSLSVHRSEKNPGSKYSSTSGLSPRQAEISDSIVGQRSFIADGVRMTQTILMGADYYDEPGVPPRGGIPLGIGPNCHIEGAIIDKNEIGRASCRERV